MNHMRQFTFLLLAMATVHAVWGKGYVAWSGREPHPAVVDPVCGYAPGTVMSLNGEWTFATFPHAADRYQFFRCSGICRSRRRSRRCTFGSSRRVFACLCPVLRMRTWQS